MSIGIQAAYELAVKAHGNQVDKIGQPYIGHLSGVAHALSGFGTGLEIGGLLHDIVEDTDTTLLDLTNAGVPYSVVMMIDRVTGRKGEEYLGRIRLICEDYSATLLKIADNAHNTQPERMQKLDAKTRERLEKKYAGARRILWTSVDTKDVRKILTRLNPSLLPLLKEYTS